MEEAACRMMQFDTGTVSEIYFLLMDVSLSVKQAPGMAAAR